MHNDFRLLAGRAEAVADEIHLGFHDREIVLRTTLKHETRPERCEIGNASYIEENVLWQYRRKSRKNLFATPPLPLEVNNIGLHEHSAAVAEDRHGLCRKCQIRVLIHAQ